MRIRPAIAAISTLTVLVVLSSCAALPLKSPCLDARLPRSGLEPLRWSGSMTPCAGSSYAEGRGDRSENPGLDDEDKKVLDRLTAAGIPVVTVLVSGRPLLVTEQLPRWKALLAAWLPGAEGAGVADVLFGDFTPVGKLPLAWPRSKTPAPGSDPLFPYGYGLTYR